MKKHENLILILLVVALVAFPLIWKAGAEFGGSDDKVQGVVAEINPGYQPWFSSIWKPPSAEVESFLFAVQAGIGAGFIGYWIGFQRGRRASRSA
ncbi:MAG: Cobalt transport protein cbiN [Firmicutes bacterium]|nr:Cobalt transport protein cbiN [Bacillota bacterium]